MLAALGCEPAPPVELPDAGAIDLGEPPPDGPMHDAALPDAMPDVAPDAALDAMPDAMPDAIPDAGQLPDATPDAIPDAIVDARPIVDAAIDRAVPDALPIPDAGPDASPIDARPVDAAVDAARDAEVDAFIPIWDAEVDQAVDAEVDLAVDAEVDLAVDAEAFEGPARSDDFEVGPLGDAWQVHNPQLFERAVRDGALWLTPLVYGLWFDRSTGPLVHQPVTGDFRVTARVRARQASAPDMPPEQLVHVGGLMARDPRTPPENYVFIVVGRDVDDLSVETKTTVGGRSAFTGPAWPDGGDAELRICRLGAEFRMYKRPIDGGAWDLAETFVRDDLPETLQVGAIAYTNSREPDLTVGFDEIIFADVAGEADCLGE